MSAGFLGLAVEKRPTAGIFKLRSLKRTDSVRVPIIAMSANAFAEDKINRRISGMNIHLAKPVDEIMLLEAFGELFSRG